MNYQNAVLFSIPAATSWLPGTLTQVTDGVVVVSLPSGEVLSVQPDGSLQTRPKGTAGPWEICTIDPKVNVLHYNPGVPYALVYRG